MAVTEFALSQDQDIQTVKADLGSAQGAVSKPVPIIPDNPSSMDTKAEQKDTKESKDKESKETFALVQVPASEMLKGLSETKSLLDGTTKDVKVISEDLWRIAQLGEVMAKEAWEELRRISDDGSVSVNVDEFDLLPAGLGNPTFRPSPEYTKGVKKFLKTYMNNAGGCGYGPAAGTQETRAMMAESLSKHYNLRVDPSEIVMTNGGLHALKTFFTVAKQLCAAEGRGEPIFCMKTPMYPPYKTDSHRKQNKIHPINVMTSNGMTSKGYRLTAALLKEHFDQALQKAKGSLVIWVFTNPGNPGGDAYDEKDLKEFAEVLNEPKYKDILTLQDNAYKKLRPRATWLGLQNVDPRLWESGRLFDVNSGTKGEGLAPVRCGEGVSKNQAFISGITDEIQNVMAHVPQETAYGYAYAVSHTSAHYYEELYTHYKSRIDCVWRCLGKRGLTMPDKDYNRSEKGGAFYVMASFKKLIGKSIPKEFYDYLDRKKDMLKEVYDYFQRKKDKLINTDVELTYILLVLARVQVLPLSKFSYDESEEGMRPQDGILRFTCNRSEAEVEAGFRRIDSCIAKIYAAHKAAKATIKAERAVGEQKEAELSNKDGVSQPASSPMSSPLLIIDASAGPIMSVSSAKEHIRGDIYAAGGHALLKTPPPMTPPMVSPAQSPRSTTQQVVGIAAGAFTLPQSALASLHFAYQSQFKAVSRSQTDSQLDTRRLPPAADWR